MKKNKVFSWNEKVFKPYEKILKIMKVFAFLMFVIVIHVSARSYSQNTKFSLNMQNVTIKQVLGKIEDQSEFRFLYSDSKIDVERKIDVDLNGRSVEDILQAILGNSNIQFKVVGRQILLSTSDDMINSSQQQKSVSGKITDMTGTSLPGVSVVVKGTTNGTITDSDGKYSISNIPANAVLQFSFVGMKSQEVSISGKSSINIVLVEDAVGIEEVVAIGYGTQKKTNLTGSVASVKGDDIMKRPITNAGALLQGTMPGVQIIQNSGQPGNEAVTINIRGTGTFSSAGSSPLVLVDGVQGDLNMLDPSTIENVSVLKDAASASIYGSRAANGVILVTTKSGSEGKVKIEYTGNYAIYSPTKLFDLITNSADYMTMWNTSRINTGLNDPMALYTQDQINAYRNATDRNKYPNYNWQNAAIKAEPAQTHNLSFNGSVGKTKYNVNLGYLDQTGTMIGNEYKRYSGRINLASQINDKIKFGTNVSFMKGNRTGSNDNDQYASIMAQAPTYSPQLADGSGRYSYKAYSMEYNNKNPFAVAAFASTYHLTYNVTSQIWTDVAIAKGLTWYTKFAYNVDFDKQNSFGPTVPLYNFQTNDAAPMTNLDLGSTPKGESEKYTLNAYNNLYSYINYDRAFGDHSIKAQVGYSQEYNVNNFIQAGRTQYVSPAAKELHAGNNADMNNDGNSYEWALRSLFGRLDYSYKNRYLLEANMRYDGSSRISTDTRWGIFPSFSAGWRVTEEQFVKDLGVSWLDNLKIRGSWGQLGNQNIGNYPYQAMLSLTSNYAFNNQGLSAGVAQTALNNQSIKWEATTISDAGFDLGLVKNLNVTFDWYDKKTTDILRQSQLTNLVGLSAPWVNDGEMENKGVELGINYNNTIKSGILSGLSYFAGVNFEHYTNKLVKFGAKQINNYTIYQEGLDYNSFYMLKWIGIFQSADEVAKSPKQYNDATQPGDLKFEDTNNDGKIDDNDRVPISGMYPKLNYSFNLGGSWKGFDLTAAFQGVAGVKQFAQWWGVIPFDQGAPPTTDWYNAWTPENHSTTMPRLYWGQNAPAVIARNSSWYLHDASYLRLKNLTIGYTIPASLTKRAGIDKLRVFFSGDNLFTITKFPGLDPERPIGNQQYAVYPQNKIVAFGVNVNF